MVVHGFQTWLPVRMDVSTLEASHRLGPGSDLKSLETLAEEMRKKWIDAQRNGHCLIYQKIHKFSMFPLNGVYRIPCSKTEGHKHIEDICFLTYQFTTRMLKWLNGELLTLVNVGGGMATPFQRPLLRCWSKTFKTARRLRFWGAKSSYCSLKLSKHVAM